MKQKNAPFQRHCLVGVDSHIISQQTSKMLIITEKIDSAKRLLEECSFYQPSWRIRLLPDWETLPYEFFSPHQELISERLKTLWEMQQDNFDLIIAPVTTAIQRLPPVSYVSAQTFFFEQGKKTSYEKVKQQLISAGYTAVKQVYRCGEFSLRGSLIDLFPMGSNEPYRLDFFDDTLEGIRSFDTETQKSIRPISIIQILPAREMPTDEKGIQLFRQNFRLQFPGDPCRTTIYKEVSQGLFPAGIEYYLPLFFTETAHLTDYLSPDTTILWHGHLEKGIEEFWTILRERYRLSSYDATKPLLPPEKLYYASTEFFEQIQPYPHLKILPTEKQSQSPSDYHPVPDVSILSKQSDPLSHLRSYHHSFPGTIVMVCHSLGRREALIDLFKKHDFPLPHIIHQFEEVFSSPETLFIMTGPLYHGWLLKESLLLITEWELFPHTKSKHHNHKKSFNWEFWIKDLSELEIEQPVVHMQYGIGRYGGLELIDLGNGPEEFVRLYYADNDKLFLPIAELNVLSRYTGADNDQAPLHKLGTAHWEKECHKAREKAHDSATELLEIYSQRNTQQGNSMSCDLDDYQKFCDDFGFEETPDQKKAIDSVLNDMARPVPMDHLICGDVGFGKTEVALRASFVAALSGHQVAILCPTTLLSSQHRALFSDRFSSWPIRIGELSRLHSSQEVKDTIQKICSGELDIVIGTHRLLQKDVQFPRLGLVIIDEEHRFGVRQKEIVQEWRATTDILSLTATPIPRTLSLCLDGIRSFSIISTPPQRRLSIKTIISPHNSSLIQEAILRELKRGGQVYFLYNEIKTISEMQKKLEKLIPEARIAIAHGQIANHQLERVMHDFHMHRYNILLCTTIIENGIDNPNANTIIIHRADRFGLAQLHQIRGRVGRSHHQAYAYLLIPDDESLLKDDAKKRLDAIRSADDLGAGFFLARHDLEIRGAGELLGEAQSGHIQKVGFALFTDMLQEEIEKLSHPDLTKQKRKKENGRVRFDQPTLIPDDYCPDVALRLNFYKRLSDCVDFDSLFEIKEELIDRFGLLPDTTKRLIELHCLRITGKSIGICEIDISKRKITLTFSSYPEVDSLSILEALNLEKSAKLLNNNGIVFDFPGELPEKIEKVKTFVRCIQDIEDKKKNKPKP